MTEYAIIIGFVALVIAGLSVGAGSAAGPTTGIICFVLMTAMSGTYSEYNRLLPWNEITADGYAKVVRLRMEGYAPREIDTAMDDRRITNLEFIEIRKSIDAGQDRLAVDASKEEILASDNAVMKLK